MRILVTIGTFAIAATGLAASTFLSTSEMLLPATLGSAAITAAVLRLFLAQFATHWSSERSTAISAAAMPMLMWLLAFGADLTAFVMNLLDPPGRYMIAFTIMLTPISLVSFIVGLVAALVAGWWIRSR